MRSRAILASFVAVGAALSFAPGVASAQSTEAAATALFDQARGLMQQGKWADACPKLAESERLAPSGGTLLNLADCYEHTGHAEFGVPIPVDPGTHVVEATAPNKQPFSSKVDVAPKQTNATLSVTLADAPQAAPTPPAAETTAAPAPATTATPAPEQPASSWSGQKTAALVVGGVGIVGLGVGSVFGLVAKSKNDQALQNCRTSTLCSQTGLDLTSDAKSAATISTVAFIAGGVALAGGIVLWLTAPSPSASTTGVRFVPLVGSTNGGALTGTW